MNFSESFCILPTEKNFGQNRQKPRLTKTRFWPVFNTKKSQTINEVFKTASNRGLPKRGSPRFWKDA